MYNNNLTSLSIYIVIINTTLDYRLKRGIMSTLTLITNFGQINAVKKFKLDLIECLYIYAVIHNIK